MKLKHKGIIKELSEQFAPVLKHSTDGVYLWLDEENMICNDKLAKMFDYSVKELCSEHPFLETFVAEKDRELFSMNYHKSVAPLARPVTFRFRGIRKDGSTFQAETDMIPISWQGHAIAYHFVRQISK